MHAPEFDQGYRTGIKHSVTWLQQRAHEMTDPWAKAVLNVAADYLGKAGKEYTLEAKARLLEVILERGDEQKEGFATGGIVSGPGPKEDGLAVNLSDTYVGPDGEVYDRATGKSIGITGATGQCCDAGSHEQKEGQCRS